MENVEITPEHLRYAAPYAARMYYGVGYRFKKDRHPLATAMWDKAAMQTQRDKLTREIAAYMGEAGKMTEFNTAVKRMAHALPGYSGGQAVF